MTGGRTQSTHRIQNNHAIVVRRQQMNTATVRRSKQTAERHKGNIRGYNTADTLHNESVRGNETVCCSTIVHILTSSSFIVCTAGALITYSTQTHAKGSSTPFDFLYWYDEQKNKNKRTKTKDTHPGKAGVKTSGAVTSIFPGINSQLLHFVDPFVDGGSVKKISALRHHGNIAYI